MTPSEPARGAAFHADFTLSITKALGDQLKVALDDLKQVPLKEANLSALRPRAGVYQLYLRGDLVYVGKAEKALPVRLRQHLRKLSGRENVSLDEISFCCLYVAEDFSALAPEKLLIRRYDEDGQAPWNHNGFGNRDPGRKRDHTKIKANHFDQEFPADLNLLVEGLRVGDVAIKDFVKQVKNGLPFTFRHAKIPERVASTPVVVNDPVMTADEAFTLIANCLPAEWQVVALLGYVIMYPDSPADYPSARRYYRRIGKFDAEPALDAPGEIEELEEGGDEE